MKFKSIRNIKIKTKLILLGAVSILGLVFIGAESIITSRQLNQASTDISQSWLPSIIIAEELNTATSDYRNKEYHHVISHDQEMMGLLEIDMMKLRRNIEDSFAEYENYIADDIDRELMDRAKACWHKYLEFSDELLAISRQNETQAALDLIISDSKRLFDESSNMFLAVVEYNRDGAEEASVSGDRLYAKLARFKVASICVIAFLIALLVVYVIAAIDKPVEALVEGTRRVANGDLGVHLDYRSEDEIGTLTDSMNQLTERLKNIIDDEKYLFREIGSENFEVKSTCQQAYRGDFAPILYSISSLMSRLGQAKENQLRENQRREQRAALRAQKLKKQQKRQNEEIRQLEEKESGRADGGRTVDATDKTGEF